MIGKQVSAGPPVPRSEFASTEEDTNPPSTKQATKSYELGTVAKTVINLDLTSSLNVEDQDSTEPLRLSQLPSKTKNDAMKIGNQLDSVGITS